MQIRLCLAITTGVFPNSFKFSKVVPVHKNESKSKYFNYRPISIINIFSKVFEVVLNRQK